MSSRIAPSHFPLGGVQLPETRFDPLLPMDGLVVGYFKAGRYPPNFVDGDEGVITAALEDAGMTVVKGPWNRKTVRKFSKHLDVALWGSPWDNWHDMSGFLDLSEFFDTVRLPQVNAYSAIKGGHNKDYLHKVQNHGFDVIPTHIIDPSQPFDIADVELLLRSPDMDSREWVIKPDVSGGSLDSGRVRTDNPRAILSLVHLIQARGKKAIAQPFRERILTDREVNIVVYNGEPINAFSKRSILEEGADPTKPKAFHPDRQPHILTPRDYDWTHKVWAAFAQEFGFKAGDRVFGRLDRIGGELLEGEWLAPVKGYGIDGMDPRGLRTYVSAVKEAAIEGRETRQQRQADELWTPGRHARPSLFGLAL
jgi:hypothetical protein